MKFSLNTKDFIKGLLVSVLTAILVVVQSTLDAGALTFDWKDIGMAAVGAAIAYLSKNFFTDQVRSAHKTIEKSQK